MYLAFFSFNCYALSFPSHFYQNLTSQNRFIASQFGARIKELREKKGIFHRQVAALLDMDNPLFSKIERGEHIAKKEIVLKLAMILKFDKDQLLSLWLADQVFEMVKDECVANAALKSVSKKIKKSEQGKYEN